MLITMLITEVVKQISANTSCVGRIRAIGQASQSKPQPHENDVIRVVRGRNSSTKRVSAVGDVSLLANDPEASYSPEAARYGRPRKSSSKEAAKEHKNAARGAKNQAQAAAKNTTC